MNTEQNLKVTINNIKSAGKNIANIGYGILANICFTALLFLFYYVAIIENKNSFSRESFQEISKYFLIVLFVVNIATFIFIVGNIFDSAKKLKNCTEDDL